MLPPDGWRLQADLYNLALKAAQKDPIDALAYE